MSDKKQPPFMFRDWCPLDGPDLLVWIHNGELVVDRLGLIAIEDGMVKRIKKFTLKLVKK